MSKKIVALLGTYRKGHVIDKMVDVMLNELSEKGAKVEKIFLADKNVEFCINCRSCTQKEGIKRGECIHKDDMNAILDLVDSSDGLIIASPVNFNNITAMSRRFMERLICYTYSPWGVYFPKYRIKKTNKRAVLVSAAGAPSFFVYLFMTEVFRALKIQAKVLGAKPIGRLCMGLASVVENPKLSAATVKKAKRLDKSIRQKSLVYKDLREKGYIPKTALKFGAEFRVYDKGAKPGKDHARWILFISNEREVLKWHELSAKNRVAHSTKKKLLLAILDEEQDITYHEISWIRP